MTSSEPGLRQSSADERVAHAVKRRVDDAERPVAAAGVHLEPPHGCEIRLGHLRGNARHEPSSLQIVERRARDVARRGSARDTRGDARIHGRHDLRAVLPVHLVAVVLGRVVAGGHDHPAGRARLLDRERDERRRGRFFAEHHAKARGREDRGGVVRELPAHAAGIATDDDATLGRTRHRRQQLFRQRPGCPRDDRAVHAIGTGAEDAAQPRRSKLERCGEPVRELGFGRFAWPLREELRELGPRPGVGILGHPPFREAAQRARVHPHALSDGDASARGPCDSRW